MAFGDCASDLTDQSGDPWGVFPGILWEVPQEYGVGGPLLKAKVHIAGPKSELFPVHVQSGRQGWPLSPVLFIILLDILSRSTQSLEVFQFGNHWITLLFADDVVLLTPSG